MRRTITAAAALLAVVAVAGSAPAARDTAVGASWTTFGNGPARDGVAAAPLPAGKLRTSFFVPLGGRVTSQVLAAADVFAPGSTTLYAATSEGRVYAVSQRGYVLWSRDLGQLATDCPQLDGYGVTGTGAIDPATRTLYVADAFGRVHALDLRSGEERPGWPVRAFSSIRREHVWGALLLADGKVFVPTGSYCDQGPMQGHVYSVDLSTREVRSWASVPAELGGGGGIWGWGGVAYSSRRDSLYVVTGNAFVEGHETAGYGEHLVELSPDLEVRASSTTPEPSAGADADLVGSPVVFERPGCGELVAAVRKDGRLFGWRTADLAAGPAWQVELERFDESNPVLAQPVWDPRRNAVVVVTGRRIVRVDVDAGCGAHVAWTRSLGTATENGLPTVAGDTIWVPLSGSWSLAAVDDATGAIRARTRLGGAVLTAPTIVAGQLVLGSFVGGLHAFSASSVAPAAAGPNSPDVPGHESRATALLRWVSRADGVYSSDDGGRSWRRIFGQPALHVLRTSRRAGLIVVGSPPPACGCRARILWTTNAGRSWRETGAITTAVAGRGAQLFWTDAAATRLLRVRRWPPGGTQIRSATVASLEAGRFVDLAAVPNGVAALVTARVDGQGWDDAPQVVVDRGGRVTTVRLPRSEGSVLARSVAASWPSLTVRGADFDADGAIVPVVWRSRDGGRTWAVERGP